MTDKQTIKFGDICKEIKLTTKDPIGDGYERYIGLEHLDSGSLKIKRWGMIAEDSPSFTRVFKKGQILLGKRRPYLKKAAIAEFDGICSGDIIVIQATGKEIPEGLLPFIIQSNNFWNWAVKTSSGSLSPRTKFKHLAEFEFTRLTSDEYHSKLKILVGLQNVLRKNEAAETSIHTFIEVTIEKMLQEASSEVYSFEELIKSGDILEIQDGNHGNDHPKASEYVDDGIPFIMASDLSEGLVDLINCKKINRTRADKLRIGFSKSGDILLSHKGTVGEVAVTPDVIDYIMLTPQVTYYRVSKTGKVIPKYLEIFFRSASFQTKLRLLSMQSTRPYIGIKAQKKLELILPSRDVQNQIINVWEELQSVKNKLLESKSAARALSESITNG